MFKTLLLIALGGGAGSTLRYLLTVFVTKQSQSVFPYGTLVVNLIGCLLIGFLLAFFEHYSTINQDLKKLLIIGFCGGFTTFSTFSLENYTLIENGNYTTAFIYTIASISIGIIAVFAGFLLSKIFI